MADLLGRLSAALAGRYQPERELGRGGMATVFLARDLRHRRPVAIKVLHPDLAACLGPERFLREIEIAAGLTHPHILPLYDSGALDEGTGRPVPFYVMPYVEGESLRDLLRRQRQLPLEDALRIACETADALAHAHTQGIVHRDIKPENILLEGGHAVVSDFGVARALSAAGAEQLTATGLAVGTPAYMSPEQAAGDHEVDSRTDVYALGCMLYEMLAGEPPFTGPTPQAVIARRLSGSLPSLKDVRDGVPPAVEGAVRKALARAPADRFQTAGQFREALAAPRGETTLVSAGSSARGGWPRSRFLAAAAAALLVAGGVWAWARSGPKPAVAAAGTNSIAVLPFRTTGPDLEVWQEGMVDLLSINLDGAAGLRTIPARTVLSRWRRSAGENPDEVEHDAVLSAARSLGAARAITGTIVGTGAGLRMVAELYDANSGQVEGRAQVEGPADSVPALVDRLSLELLRSGAATDGKEAALDLRGITTGSLTALKSYLAGERAFRRAQPREAVNHYQAAVEADTTFALGWYRLAIADSWSKSPHVPFWTNQEHVDQALRHAGHLPAREALHLQALQQLIVGLPRVLETLRAATGRYPDDAETWYLLGDALFHVGGIVLAPREEFRNALRRATELDPGFAPAYLHLAEDAFDRLDSAEASRILGVLRGIDATSPKATGLALAFDLAWGDSAAQGKARSALDTASTLAILTAKHATDVTSDLWQPALAAAMALANQPRHPMVNRAQGEFGAAWTYAIRGRIVESLAADRRGGTRLGDPPEMLDAYGHEWALRLAMAGSPDTARAKKAYRFFKGTPDSISPPEMMIWYAASVGDSPELARWARITDSATMAAAARGDTVGQLGYRQLSRLIQAYTAERSGDRSAVLEELGRREMFPLSFRRVEEQLLRFQAARRHYEAKNLAEARRFFESFDISWAPMLFAVNQYYLGRIAEELGEPARAKEHYARTVRWWADCDPELRPFREQAREALARLSAEPITS